MIQFEPVEGCKYRYDYQRIFHDVGEKPDAEGLAILRSLILSDLFFIVCFVMQIEKANCPFVVDMCKRVENGPSTGTLDVWAREHFKSTIITIAETLQYHLKNPAKSTAIFAYARPAAKAFLRSLKNLCEESDLLKACFPDVIWENPLRDSPKWSEDDGLIFKGHNPARKESTIEAWGLLEGMPTGRHFDRRIYDDIEVHDIADSPEMLAKCFSRFEMSDNLGVDEGIERVIGTFYTHEGPIAWIRDKKDALDKPMYDTRIVPATDDGTVNGAPVLLSQARLDRLKTSSHFNSQQLCDPTPTGERSLNPEYLRPVDDDFVPLDLMKFMLIDPAGDRTTQASAKDAWAFGVFGVKPHIDDSGASEVYILDLEIDQHSHASAIEAAVRMYMRNGVVMQVGIEKVGQSTAEIHIANALRAHNRHISVDAGSLKLLQPGKRKKSTRIEENVQWPLNNGKLFYSRTVRADAIERLKMEMDKFPHWHDDGLDILAYLFEMVKEFKFVKNTKQKVINYDFRGVV